MSDIAELAKAALEALDRSAYGGSAEAAALQRIARENTFIREARMLVPELVAEVERLQHELRDAARRIKAFAKDCATHGDMTPMAKIQWNKLADTIAKVEP